jgi:hypothetical protein
MFKSGVCIEGFRFSAEAKALPPAQVSASSDLPATKFAGQPAQSAQPARSTYNLTKTNSRFILPTIGAIARENPHERFFLGPRWVDTTTGCWGHPVFPQGVGHGG